MGFAVSILSGFVTYEMTTAIMDTTRDAQQTTIHIQTAITDREFERQLFTLFHMKQMMAALIFFVFYAAFAFVSNLFFIITQTQLSEPFVSDTLPLWFQTLKVLFFNFYLYALVSIFLIYTKLSREDIESAALILKHHNSQTPATKSP